MARKRTVPFLTMFLTVFLVLALALSVISFAYFQYNGGYHERVVPIKTVFVASMYDMPLTSAVYHWNTNMPSSGTQKRVVELVPTSDPSTNYVYTKYYYNDDWYGQYEVLTQNTSAPSNRATKFQIKVNHALCENENYLFKMSVIAHEIGHAYGLDENNYSGNLMDQERNRNLVYVPQADDIAGAKYMASLLP